MAKPGLALALLVSCLAPLGVARAEPASERATSERSSARQEETGDATIRRALWRRLAGDRDFGFGQLEVAVQRGIVLLTGTVAVSPASTRAARTARAIEGVRAVVNRVRTEPVRRPDSQVAREVRRALRRTAALASMPISVVVSRGVVQLRGSITSWDEQQLAERVAMAVPGVRFCQNQLSLTRSLRRTDAIVAADVQTRLERDPYVAQAPIRVVARRGRVILAGTVAWPAQRTRVLEHAWVRGVTSVDADALLVGPSPPGQDDLRRTWPNDADIQAALADLVSYWPQLAAATPSTVVVGGVVTLRGTVATLADRDAAQRWAQSAVGVVEVRNDLRGPWWRAPAPAPVRAKPAVRRKSGRRSR